MLSALPRGGADRGAAQAAQRRWEVALNAGNISRRPLLVQTDRTR